MREVNRSALVPYSTDQMFELVADFERYPDFVPWVAGAELIERREGEHTARLHMERSGLSEKFTTRNRLEPPRLIKMQLIDGPFRLLEGEWTFAAIQEKGSKIDLSIRFEFSNPVTALLLSKSFEKSCSQLIDAFVARARDVYGKS